RLRAWVGGLERFTPAAAADMVASLDDGYGESMAAWRDGAVVRRALPALTGVELPPFPGRVSVFPYLSTETRRVAAGLGLVDAEWHHVFAGARTLATLNELRGGAGQHVTEPGGTGRQGADAVRSGAARLVAAADLDLAGRRPYQLLVLELSGVTASRTLTLRAGDGYRLTAAVGVAAVLAVLAGAVPAGAHLADEVLDPEPVVALVGRDPEVTVLHVSEADAAELVEEGVL
ncbi:MAG TPA: epimerase, partial [Pseudonocardiaceae bacterium]